MRDCSRQTVRKIKPQPSEHSSAIFGGGWNLIIPSLHTQHRLPRQTLPTKVGLLSEKESRKMDLTLNVMSIWLKDLTSQSLGTTE